MSDAEPTPSRSTTPATSPSSAAIRPIGTWRPGYAVRCGWGDYASCRVLPGRSERNERTGKGQPYQCGAGREARHPWGEHLPLCSAPSVQGEDLLLKVESFLRARPNTKAIHHRMAESAFKKQSPEQFRRIIAAFIQPESLQFTKVNYLPEHTSRYPLPFILGLLNTSSADWYFRWADTKRKPSADYQLYNLPCPLFAVKHTAARPSCKGRGKAPWPRGGG